MFMCSTSHAQYYIPQQAWGGSYNYGYGAYRNNYNNYGGYNNYNNNYTTGSDYYNPRAREYYNPAKRPPAYNSNPNPVTESNKYLYPSNNPNGLPYAEPVRQTGGIANYKYIPKPNIRGVVLPEPPVYSQSAGKRK